MHQDIGLLSGLIDEVSCGLEVNAKIIIGMVFPWNIEGKWDMLLGMLDVYIFAGS